MRVPRNYHLFVIAIVLAIVSIGVVVAVHYRSAGQARASIEKVAPMVTNRQVIEDFLDMINRQRRIREAFDRYVSESYVQHNPAAGNGRKDAIALIEGLAAAPGFSPSVKRIVAEGDLVAVHMHVQFSGDRPDLAVMDMFRLSDGKIVEHWDVIQEVPAWTVSGNSMF